MLRLLATPPAEEPLGVRDRAILETLYSAGLRVSELTGLNVDDVDLDAGWPRCAARAARNASPCSGRMPSPRCGSGLASGP